MFDPVHSTGKEITVKETINTDIRVRYAETDQMGIAYYANYLIWFEVGRSEFCRQRDFSYAVLEGLGYKLVVTEAQCRYRNAARYDDLITVQTRLKALDKRIITFGYEIVRKDKDELIAEGETRHLCVDAAGKPKSLPKEFLTRLAGH